MTLLGDAVGAKIRCTAHTEEDLLVPFWRIGNQVVPAFKAGNAEALYRLTLRASGACDRLKFNGRLSKSSRLAPIGVQQKEAQITAAIATFRRELDRNPRAVFSRPADDEFSGELLMIAFRPRDYFWVDSTLDAIAFERALLK